MRTNIIYITLSYKRTPRTEVAYINCLASSLSTSIGKALVPSSSVLFTYLSIGNILLIVFNVFPLNLLGISRIKR